MDIMMNEPIIWPPKYIDPTTDFGFKRIFKDEEITRGFLNDLVQSRDPDVHIASVTITDGEADEANKDIRRVVYDVNCVTDTGEEFIIEMQNDSQDFFSDRIVFYLARAVSRQQGKGFLEFVDENGEPTKEPWKYNLKNIYGVFFMNFTDKEHPQKLSHFQFMETKEHFKDSDALQYWKIQMPLYRKMKESDCETVIDKWIYNLSNMPKMKTQLAFKQDKPLFMRLEKLASYSDMTR
ncbi:MAG: PD-(D/E)XK nuclease family transposase, partial [Bacteroidales bacterium]|nr:PD-(D/E)XK nuclease family transposase [Bacteroidales bacterium]